MFARTIILQPSQIDGSAQDCSNSSALALELLQACVSHRGILELPMHIFLGRCWEGAVINANNEDIIMKNILDVHEKAQIQNGNAPESWQN